MLRASIEVDPSGVTMGHVLGLPGCITLEPSSDAATAALHDAVRDYGAWLQRHGERPDFDAGEGVAVVERIARGPYGSGGEMALFAVDREPVSDADITRTLILLEYTRADFLSAWEALPAAARTWHPDPDARIPLEIVEHVRNADWWYFNRIREDLDEPTIDPDIQVHHHVYRVEFAGRTEHFDLLASLHAVRAWLREELPTLTAEEREQVFTPRAHPTDNPNEQWTARKMLRRMLEHEREHTANLWQRRDQYGEQVEDGPAAHPIGGYLVRLGRC